MSEEAGRRQARAMDIPGFHLTPFIRDIPKTKGSWGWVFAGDLAQDDDGYLWADGDSHPRFTLDSANRVAMAWSEDGLVVWVDPASLARIGRVEGEVERSRWIPVSAVLTERPVYAR